MDFSVEDPIHTALSTSSLLQPLLTAFESYGIDLNQPLHKKNISLSRIGLKGRGFFQSLINLLEYGQSVSNDPLFALRSSSFIKAEHLGLLGLTLQSAQTGQLYNNWVSEMFPVLPKPFPNIAVKAVENRTTIEIAWSREDSHARMAQLTEYIFGCAFHCGPVITGHPTKMEFVRFSHTAMAPVTEYEKLFCCPVSFDSDSNYCAATSSGRSVGKFHNEPLFNELELLFSRFFRRVKIDGIDEIREIMRSELKSGRPNQREVANRMSISESTLRRHLMAKGTTFQKELDAAMRDTATFMFDEENMGIKSVSEKLQYSDPSAFHRAFKRWTDLTPAQYLHRRRNNSPEK